MERTKTGVKGLDEILKGGIPKNSVVLVSGAAGSGKTILGLQFLVNGAVEFGERGLFVTFEESRNDVTSQALQFGWDLEKLESEGKLKIMTFVPSKHHLSYINSEIDSAIDEFKPQRLVYDSISTIGVYAEVIADVETLMNLGLKKEDVTIHLPPETVTRRAVMDIMGKLKSADITSLVISELPKQSSYLSRDTISEFIADGIVLLHCLEKKEKKIRAVEVLKMRRTEHSMDLVPMIISERGIEVLVGEKVY
ncbi:MAG: ATPase domain-containing protein [Candidatus Micrarchaeia archaeon]